VPRSEPLLHYLDGAFMVVATLGEAVLDLHKRKVWVWLACEKHGRQGRNKGWRGIVCSLVLQCRMKCALIRFKIYLVVTPGKFTQLPCFSTSSAAEYIVVLLSWQRVKMTCCWSPSSACTQVTTGPTSQEAGRDGRPIDLGGMYCCLTLTGSKLSSRKYVHNRGVK
jgi:hypothetical protein